MAVKSEKLTDEKLVESIRHGHPRRYFRIVERYQGKLFAYLYLLIGSKEEAEDLLQDVFIKAFRHLDSVDTKRKFSSWIYRIAHNEAVNFMKRRRLKRFISWEEVTSTKDKLETMDTNDNPEKIWSRKEERNKVNEAIEKLPQKYQQVLLLRYFNNNSYEEISRIIDKPLNTVGTLLNRAKKRLLEEIMKERK
ncbi:MAG: RNA polymerase sigma factor [Candidatus Moranbacteria bacterium]|nr:RNA polymerase sigma factor [Candidatus Moranbacteria bacterium]